MIYFTSDLHLGHTNIIESCRRPFATTEEMDQTIIKNWNSTIQEDDEIYVLGDFFWTRKDFIKYKDKLKGRKYLIKGNHDSNYLNKEAEEYFEWVKDYYVLKYNKVKHILFHYPILNWDGMWRGSKHLHGHTHNKEVDYIVDNAHNVGVDINGFRPICINEIEE